MALKGPEFKREEGPFDALLAREIIKQREEARKPSLTAQVEFAKRAQEIGEEAAVLKNNLLRMKKLFDQAARPKPGIQRPIGFLQNVMRQQFEIETGPQIDQFEDFKKAIAGNLTRIIGGERASRLSDFDIQRVLNAIPSIRGATKDRGLLGWEFLFQTVDDVVGRYSNPAFQPDPFGRKSFPNIEGREPFIRLNARDIIFSNFEKGRARALSGDFNFETFSDDEIIGTAAGDASRFSKVVQTRLFEQVQARGLRDSVLQLEEDSDRGLI